MPSSSEVLAAIRELSSTKQLERSELLDLLRDGIHAALVEGLRNGTLRPVVGQEIPLAQAPRAHEVVMQDGHYGKVVLTP